nr:unnamed protein product [Callosobruchus chinensis]
MSEVTGISRTSIQRILKHYKWHPYKIQLLHELNEDDHDRRLQFCEIIKMSEVTGISRTSIQRILKHYKWHPYKIQLLHELNEDDHDRRLQFCEIMSQLT